MLYWHKNGMNLTRGCMRRFAGSLSSTIHLEKNAKTTPYRAAVEHVSGVCTLPRTCPQWSITEALTRLKLETQRPLFKSEESHYGFMKPWRMICVCSACGSNLICTITLSGYSVTVIYSWRLTLASDIYYHIFLHRTRPVNFHHLHCAEGRLLDPTTERPNGHTTCKITVTTIGTNQKAF